MRQSYELYLGPEVSTRMPDPEHERRMKKGPEPRPVIATDKKGYARRYASITEAANNLGCTIQSIWRALGNPKYTCKGFRWKYETS